MPPFITVNPEDIEVFHKRVEMWLNSHGGKILSSILGDYAHSLKHFYGDDFKDEVINSRYYKTDDTYNGYDIWRKKG